MLPRRPAFFLACFHQMVIRWWRTMAHSNLVGKTFACLLLLLGGLLFITPPPSPTMRNVLSSCHPHFASYFCIIAPTLQRLNWNAMQKFLRAIFISIFSLLLNLCCSFFFFSFFFFPGNRSNDNSLNTCIIS